MYAEIHADVRSCAISLRPNKPLQFEMSAKPTEYIKQATKFWRHRAYASRMM